MKIGASVVTLVGFLALGGLVVRGSAQQPRSAGGLTQKETTSWEELLQKRIPLYGHRNWIVVADSAYPSQSRAGIETVATGADQLEVVKTVLAELAKTKHVRPTIYLDAELPHVAETDAHGISAYRRQLKRALGSRSVQSIPHEQIIGKLDKAGEQFHVLILKTNMTIPYTSVFIELGCGYWSDAAEERLRKSLKGSQEKPSREPRED